MSCASEPRRRRALHVLTKPGDALAAGFIAGQEADPGVEVRVVDLCVADPDYAALFEAIFVADCVAVW